MVVRVLFLSGDGCEVPVCWRADGCEVPACMLEG
jgi:hypothetical protein